MHLTEIILKDGRKFSGYIERTAFDPDTFEHSYIKLFKYYKIFYICDIKSAITESDRIGLNEVSDINKIEVMRQQWEEYKKGKIHEIPLVEEKYRLPSEC